MSAPDLPYCLTADSSQVLRENSQLVVEHHKRLIARYVPREAFDLEGPGPAIPPSVVQLVVADRSSVPRADASMHRA